MTRHDQIGAVQSLLRAWRQVWNVIGNTKYHLITSSSLAFWPAALLAAGVIAASAAQPLRIPIVVDFPDGAETACSGWCVQLAGEETLRFKRGAPLPDGSYAFR
ncbi:MAG: hypothetical protein ACOYCD_07575 [Kiritimatiellia bacterium]|jgi:hypothetical protein